MQNTEVNKEKCEKGKNKHVKLIPLFEKVSFI